jgi:hypothetical protein
MREKKALFPPCKAIARAPCAASHPVPAYATNSNEMIRVANAVVLKTQLINSASLRGVEAAADSPA